MGPRGGGVDLCDKNKNTLERIFGQEKTSQNAGKETLKRKRFPYLRKAVSSEGKVYSRCQGIWEIASRKS